MDLMTLRIMQPHVQQALPSLDPTMSPEACRDVSGWPEARVKSILRTVATEIYNHEKASNIWRANCMDGSNALLYWLNRVDMEKPTSPRSVVRMAAKERLTASAGTAHGVPNPQRHTTLGPSSRIVPKTTVELAEYKHLYYMICAKLRQLYRDLQLRFDNGFLRLDQELHSRGEDTNSYAPFTVADMARLFQSHWSHLMAPELVSTLDRAVRERNFRKKITQPLLRASVPGYDPGNHRPEDDEVLNAELLKRQADPEEAKNAMLTDGLLDTNRMEHFCVIMTVAKEHALELYAENEEEQRRESLRAEKRAEVHYAQSTTIQGNERQTNGFGSSLMSATDFLQCTCDVDCICRIHCAMTPSMDCVCRTHPMLVQFRGQRQIDEVAVDLLTREYGEPVGEDYLFHAQTNEVAQLQVAAAALPNNPTVVQATKEVQETITQLEMDFVERKLSSEGVVPPRTPTKVAAKKVKDQYPLGFYTPLSSYANANANANESNEIFFRHSDGLSTETPSRKSSHQPSNAPLTPPDTRSANHKHNRSKSYGTLLGGTHPLQLSPKPAYDPFVDELSMPGPLNVGARNASMPSYRVPFEQNATFGMSRPATHPGSPSRATSSNTYIPLRERRYVSAGGPGRVDERPEAAYNIPPPMNTNTFSLSAEQMKALTVKKSDRSSSGEEERVRRAAVKKKRATKFMEPLKIKLARKNSS